MVYRTVEAHDGPAERDSELFFQYQRHWYNEELVEEEEEVITILNCRLLMISFSWW